MAVRRVDFHRHLDVPSREWRPSATVHVESATHVEVERVDRQRIVMNQHDERSWPALLHQPVSLPTGNPPFRVMKRETPAPDRKRTPRRRHRVERGEAESGGRCFEKRRGRRDTVRTFADSPVERTPPGREHGWRIPESGNQAPDVGALARVPAARREVVVSVNDGQPIAMQESARSEGIEGCVEQRRRPAVEEIAGDDEMIGLACDDAVEPPGEFGRVAFVAEVQV